MPTTQQFADVNGRRIAYLEAGSGDPIVLLHGNPTSSYLWRNIIPELEGCGRVIAPDLIGQGDSEKLPASGGADRYSFEVAFAYLDGLLRQIGAYYLNKAFQISGNSTNITCFIRFLSFFIVPPVTPYFDACFQHTARHTLAHPT